MVKGHSAAMGAADLAVVIMIHLLKVNRQKRGQEAGLPNHGLLVPHIESPSLCFTWLCCPRPLLSGYRTRETTMRKMLLNSSSDSHTTIRQKPFFPPCEW